jgi:DNA (cytosine-5)-methyltransferase 1
MHDMALRPQRIVSLCTGYGGLELGLEIAGVALQPLVYVEREVYAAANLVDRMEEQAIPEAPIWDDLTTFDARSLRGLVDGITGGYPCQPFSLAGKRKGTEDERHLWPHFARIIRECEPRWCFFENVSNHLRMGFREVADELRELGYRVAATLVTASEVGAPHKRERLFILAHRDGAGLLEQWGSPGCISGKAQRDNVDGCSRQRVADPDFDEREWEHEPREPAGDGRAESQGGYQGVADPNNHGGRNQLEEWGSEERASTSRNSEVPNVGDTNVFDSEQAELWEASGCGFDEPGVFPPGRDPGDRGWAEWPWPCVESEIRQRPDGHPHWVDELRLCGGGVVPLQAAYAFSILATDLWEYLRGGGEVNGER